MTTETNRAKTWQLELLCDLVHESKLPRHMCASLWIERGGWATLDQIDEIYRAALTKSIDAGLRRQRVGEPSPFKSADLFRPVATWGGT